MYVHKKSPDSTGPDESQGGRETWGPRGGLLSDGLKVTAMGKPRRTEARSGWGESSQVYGGAGY